VSQRFRALRDTTADRCACSARVLLPIAILCYSQNSALKDYEPYRVFIAPPLYLSTPRTSPLVPPPPARASGWPPTIARESSPLSRASRQPPTSATPSHRHDCPQRNPPAKASVFPACSHAALILRSNAHTRGGACWRPNHSSVTDSGPGPEAGSSRATG
jgi:hypothetical protein